MANIQKPNSEIGNFVKYIHKHGQIKSFSKDIFLIKLYVAGLDFTNNIDNIMSKINTGDKLELIREPENKYDKKAIFVKYDGEKIGYVPRKNNEILANLMDSGKYLYGVVDEFGADEIYEGYCDRFLKFKIILKEEY